jgi:murein DD-endopeptidase MepM/ murein hydrolase activator NlpD
MTTQNIYIVPLPPDAILLVVKDELFHEGIYQDSIDYAVPVGTSVLAAADGTVTRVRHDSRAYGKDPKFGQDVNYISILHKNNEISEYLHLNADSSLVKVGDKIKAGQQIATTGLSGWLTHPHLHFMVYKKTDSWGDFKCLEVRFEPEAERAG